MERKIGEIFQVKGRRVQVVEQTNVCDCFGCCFKCADTCFINEEAGECDSANRVDRKEVIFKALPDIYFLSRGLKYKFDFTGKRVKYARDNGKFLAQTKFDLAWFIDRINPDLHMEICEDVYKYDEIKQMFLELLTEKAYSNVQIIK